MKEITKYIAIRKHSTIYLLTNNLRIEKSEIKNKNLYLRVNDNLKKLKMCFIVSMLYCFCTSVQIKLKKLFLQPKINTHINQWPILTSFV